MYMWVYHGSATCKDARAISADTTVTFAETLREEVNNPMTKALGRVAYMVISQAALQRRTGAQENVVDDELLQAVE